MQNKSSKIYKIKMESIRSNIDESVEGYTFKNVTMLSTRRGGFMTVSFSHPSRCPNMEEIRTLIDRIYPTVNLFIPLRLHTLQSNMVTAIELTVEPPDKGDQNATQVSADQA